jgi:hypothetical protein
MVLYLSHTNDKGETILASVKASLSAGMLGGIAGVCALGTWTLALISGFGGFALILLLNSSFGVQAWLSTDTSFFLPRK